MRRTAGGVLRCWTRNMAVEAGPGPESETRLRLGYRAMYVPMVDSLLGDRDGGFALGRRGRALLLEQRSRDASAVFTGPRLPRFLEVRRRSRQPDSASPSSAKGKPLLRLYVRPWHF